MTVCLGSSSSSPLIPAFKCSSVVKYIIIIIKIIIIIVVVIISLIFRI